MDDGVPQRSENKSPRDHIRRIKERRRKEKVKMESLTRRRAKLTKINEEETAKVVSMQKYRTIPTGTSGVSRQASRAWITSGTASCLWWMESLRWDSLTLPCKTRLRLSRKERRARRVKARMKRGKESNKEIKGRGM